MVMLEKLTLNNIDVFKEIYFKNFNEISYNKDFFKCYDNQNFLIKFLYRKFIRLIKINGIYIGYIWFDSTDEEYTKVWALYIDNNYISLINERTLSYFNNNILSYEEIDNTQKSLLLSKLGFQKNNYTFLLKMDISKYINKYLNEDILTVMKDQVYEKTNQKNKIKFSVRKLEAGKDEVLRCHLQNDIFAQVNRRPLNLDDIFADTAQDYYLDNLCFFGMVNNEYIGYGQIIFNRNMYTIVNFGIISKYRGLGLSKLLLNEIIMEAKNYGINDLYIRVDYDNIKAINLYKGIGFKDLNKIALWERKYKVH